jgi:glycosyltransferase involved in cell wall biosynthesis
MPKVSVIIPVFNRYRELERAVESVVSQTMPDLEIILVDDGSSPSITSNCNLDDPRITLIRFDTCHGVSFARNRGIEKSTAPLIALLDSDDEWVNNKLEMQLNYISENTGTRVVHTEETWIRNGKRVNQKHRHRKEGGDIFNRSLELCLMSPSSILLSRDIFDSYGQFDESLVVCEDYDMWLRITAHEKVGFIDTALTIKYGGHDDQLSIAYPAMDRYRVISLIKLLSNHQLSTEKHKLVIETIRHKARILYQGAVKRNKQDDAELYLRWIRGDFG